MAVMDVREMQARVSHPDPAVRRAVSLDLPPLSPGDEPTEAMLQAALTLSRDTDALVRDCACLALGTQWRTVDTPQLRSALADRLDDHDRDTRHEALLGLAYRGDPRAWPRVRAALSRPAVERSGRIRRRPAGGGGRARPSPLSRSARRRRDRGLAILDQMLAVAPSRAPEFFDAILARLASDEAAEQELRHHSALAQLAADLD